MDNMSLHLLQRLTAIRETQLEQGQILAATATAVAALKPATHPTISNASLKEIGKGAAQWLGGILALAYLFSGGDAGQALAFLQKLF